MFRFGRRSAERLEGAHDDFQLVANRAILLTSVDFGFSEVKRTQETQQHYVDTGRSQTLNSRHIPDTSGKCYAGDVYAYVDGKASYQEKHLRPIAKAFFKAAIQVSAEEGRPIEIEWGGHWKNFVDMPHFQLSFNTHPKQE
jgi:peptidoglycan L-alanyl-D-glutamate endopeptidase CwlK